MFSKRFPRIALALLGVALLPLLASAHGHDAGDVFTLNNSATDNRVVVFSRTAHGVLHAVGSYSTGGKGTGAGLGSQGALAFTRHDRWLLAVNAGSDELSVFSTRGGRLTLTDKVPSGGKHPISLTVDKNLVYVLNAGGAVGASDNVTGFYLTFWGKLLALPGSTRPLSAASTGPAQVSFSPSGDQLVVTEKMTNLIDAFWVDDDGVAGPATSTPSAGQTPFGFAFAPTGAFIVSEAFGGAPGASTLSSYRVGAGGSSQALTAALATTQTAACWVAVAKHGRFAYATNTGSNTVTGVRVAKNGTITLLQPGGVSAATGATPIDAAVSDDDRFLYVLNSGSHSISQYRIEPDGTLVALGWIGGLPAGTVGLVAD